MAPITRGHCPQLQDGITLKGMGLAHYQSGQGADTWAVALEADETLIGTLPGEVELS